MSETTWRAAGVSVRGTSHEKTGQPCQDAVYWETFPHGLLVTAVADGAGSAALGEVGATVAVRAAVDRVRIGVEASELIGADREAPEAWRALLADAILSARAGVEAEAAARNVKPVGPGHHADPRRGHARAGRGGSGGRRGGGRGRRGRERGGTHRAGVG